MKKFIGFVRKNWNSIVSCVIFALVIWYGVTTYNSTDVNDYDLKGIWEVIFSRMNIAVIQSLVLAFALFVLKLFMFNNTQSVTFTPWFTWTAGAKSITKQVDLTTELLDYMVFSNSFRKNAKEVLQAEIQRRQHINVLMEKCAQTMGKFYLTSKGLSVQVEIVKYDEQEQHIKDMIDSTIEKQKAEFIESVSGDRGVSEICIGYKFNGKKYAIYSRSLNYKFNQGDIEFFTIIFGTAFDWYETKQALLS